jgi:hypothetical protein
MAELGHPISDNIPICYDGDTMESGNKMFGRAPGMKGVCPSVGIFQRPRWASEMWFVLCGTNQVGKQPAAPLL